MRFTIHPGGDVEVPDGVTLGSVRPALAALTGAGELLGVPLGVDGRPVGDAHVSGAAPWVPGSVLEVGAGQPDPAAVAASASWHVAVLTGPDAGLVVAPGRDGAVQVGRAPDDAAPSATRRAPARRPGILSLADPGVSRRHATLRPARSRARGRATRPASRLRWLVTDRHSTNGTRVAGRRAGAVGRRLRADQPVRVGDTLVVARPSPPTAPQEPPAPTAAEPQVPSAGVGTWLMPLLISGGLALTLRNPLYLALALAAPAAVLLPAVLRGRGPRTEEPPLAHDAAGLAVRLATRTEPLPDGAAPPGRWQTLAREGLAVVGPVSGQVGRVLVAERLEAPVRVRVHTPRATDWDWTRWVGEASGGTARVEVRAAGDGIADAPDETATLVVLDAQPADPDLHRWWATGRRAQDAALVLVGRGEDVPGWCRWVLHVAADGSGQLTGPGTSVLLRAPLGSVVWAARHGRRLAAAWRAPETRAHLPSVVALADVIDPGTAAALAERWRAASRSGPVRTMAAPLGAGSQGTVSADLIADGPHALVAGTTGSGKSELLQAWVLGLALQHPPDRLALVLVDYKGGAGFGPCRDLPHVVGTVTDLDRGEAGRALAGLRAEMHRRKQLLATTGHSDLEALRAVGSAPPRLVVVVDEFRAMAEDQPQFVPGLVDLAAQGRSLGMHLVLATQRPAGAVTAQMRANLSIRVCLRVTDAADSVDVVEVPDAAALPADRPGRALVRLAGGAAGTVQTPWAAAPPGTWGRDGGVRWADHARGGGVQDRPEVARTQHTEVLVARCRAAATRVGTARPARVWAPPLPARLSRARVQDELGSRPPARGPGPAAGALVLGLSQPSGQTSAAALTWRPGAGPLAVAGGPGSGRSGSLATIAQEAVTQGWAVHVAHGAGSPVPDLVGPAAASVCADDPRRLARLLTVLMTSDRAGDPGAERRDPGHLLVVDDVGAVQRALDRLARGAGTGLLEHVLRDGRHLAVAVSGSPADLVRLIGQFSVRLVLELADRHEAALLGVQPGPAAAPAAPGRGVLLVAQEAVPCQVALPGAPLSRSAREPVRLVGLPRSVDVEPADLPRTGPGAPEGPVPGAVLLGRGGDAAGPLLLGTRPGALVVGPPGSGRSTTLAVAALGLVHQGLRVVAVGGPGPLGDLAQETGLRLTADRDEAVRLVEVLRGAPGPPLVVVADDVDCVQGDRLDAALAAWCTAARAGDAAPHVLVSARTDRAAGAYRGVLAAVRDVVVVLAPGTPGSAEVAGQDLSLLTDPGRPAPGRGVLVDRSGAQPVQVARLTPVRGARPTGRA